MTVVAAENVAGAVDVAVAGWERVMTFFETLATVVPSGMPGPETEVPTMGAMVSEVRVSVLLLLMTNPSRSTGEMDEADAGFERVTVLAVDAVTMVPSWIPAPVMDEPTSIVVPAGERVMTFLPTVVMAFAVTALVEAAVVSPERVTLVPDTEDTVVP